MKKRTSTTVCLLFLASLCTSCSDGVADGKVHEAKGRLPKLPAVDVTSPDRFLNDLKLSPLWKVEKRRDHSYIATARSIGPDSPFDETGRRFLFELMASADKTLPRDYRIRNTYLDGEGTFSTFQIAVLFQKPDLTRMTLGKSGEQATLGVYESYDRGIGLNSTSDLAIKLSSKHEVYVILHEKGSDPDRRATFAKVLPALRELADLAGSPETYRVEERYSAFFELFFKPPFRDQEIKRLPGIQDCDTFYGYFRAKPKMSYSGVNIKISHPVYCPDEGTRKYSRLQKAEYLGVPYHEKDILFFLIEDNAVYLAGKYDKRFGTFTGKESFDGNLEVLNDKGVVLSKTTGKFKGWQR